MKKSKVTPLNFSQIMKRDSKVKSTNSVSVIVIEWGKEENKQVATLQLNGELAAKFYGTFSELFAKDYAEIYYEISPNWTAV